MEKVIARKSYSVLFTEILYLLFFTPLFIISIIYLASKETYFGLIFSILIILSSIYAIIIFIITPKKIIVLKDDYLIIYPKAYNEKRISISSIAMVGVNFIDFTRKPIIIKTITGGIKIYYVKDRKNVVKEINNLVQRKV